MRIPTIAEEPLLGMSIYIPVSGLRFKIIGMDRRTIYTDHPHFHRVDRAQWRIITTCAQLAEDDRSVLPAFRKARISEPMRIACSRVARGTELPKAVAKRMQLNLSQLKQHTEDAGFVLEDIEARFWLAMRRAYRADVIGMKDIVRLSGESVYRCKRQVKPRPKSPVESLDIDKIEGAIQGGKSLACIARHAGVSRTSLVRWIESQGKCASVMHQQYKKTRDGNIKRMRIAGSSYVEIARAIGVSRETAKLRSVALGVA